ncbi:uncharacterized protein LOC143636466 [Bidens hawaiensis]|uniref:uncharacterized protein LOC143636466 n=1 Tax=Bidens hawaiensis TaxID=980011 RepID=UPI00404906D3
MYLCSGQANLEVVSGDCDCSFESNTTCRVIKITITSQNVSTFLPSEFAKLHSLQSLDLSRNYLEGTIPSMWSTMRLSTLSLMGNRLHGRFPVSLTKMATLTDLRISDNDFGGKIPNFISKWTQIGKLHIQGCMFEGPIPSSISALTQLNDLRISDLIGGASTFPPLEKMKQLKIL